VAWTDAAAATLSKFGGDREVRLFASRAYQFFVFARCSGVFLPPLLSLPLLLPHLGRADGGMAYFSRTTRGLIFRWVILLIWRYRRSKPDRVPDNNSSKMTG